MINYLQGDATVPIIDSGIRVIAHICNDAGRWGAGFSGAVSKRWKEPEEFYRKQFKFAKSRFKLGSVQWVFIETKLAVVNMIAQKNVRSPSNPKPIRYEALEECMIKFEKGCHGLGDGNNITIHMPRIGCGLAGGSWDRIEPLIDDIFLDFDVYIYDL